VERQSWRHKAGASGSVAALRGRAGCVLGGGRQQAVPSEGQDTFSPA